MEFKRNVNSKYIVQLKLAKETSEGGSTPPEAKMQNSASQKVESWN